MNADGSGKRNLTRNPANDAAVPPGRRTGGGGSGFVNRDGRPEAHVMNADRERSASLTVHTGPLKVAKRSWTMDRPPGLLPLLGCVDPSAWPGHVRRPGAKIERPAASAFSSRHVERPRRKSAPRRHSNSGRRCSLGLTVGR